MVLRNLWSPEKHFKVKRSLFKILIYSDCVPVFVMNLFLLYIYSIFKDYSMTFLLNISQDKELSIIMWENWSRIP